MHSFTSRSSKCISTAQARRVWWASAGALQGCAPGVFDLEITFRGRRKGNLVLSSWWWSSACPGFVAGAVNRDFWTCGSFSEIGRSLERNLHFGILTSSLEMLLLQIALAWLRGVSLSLRGRHANFLASAALVNLEVKISWQTQCFVDLELFRLGFNFQMIGPMSGTSANNLCSQF